MKTIINYQGLKCYLVDEQEKHIIERHPEANIHLITKCLQEPFEIRQSSSSNHSHLYYIYKTETRLFCVVLKCCENKNFISTAYTTNKIKNGEIIYKRES